MSITIVPYLFAKQHKKNLDTVVRRDKRLKLATRLICMEIMDMINFNHIKNKQAFVILTYQFIANKLNISVNTVKASLKELEELQYIQITQTDAKKNIFKILDTNFVEVQKVETSNKPSNFDTTPKSITENTIIAFLIKIFLFKYLYERKKLQINSSSNFDSNQPSNFDKQCQILTKQPSNFDSPKTPKITTNTTKTNPNQGGSNTYSKTYISTTNSTTKKEPSKIDDKKINNEKNDNVVAVVVDMLKKDEEYKETQSSREYLEKYVDWYNQTHKFEKRIQNPKAFIDAIVNGTCKKAPDFTEYEQFLDSRRKKAQEYDERTKQQLEERKQLERKEKEREAIEHFINTLKKNEPDTFKELEKQARQEAHEYINTDVYYSTRPDKDKVLNNVLPRFILRKANELRDQRAEELL